VCRTITSTALHELAHWTGAEHRLKRLNNVPSVSRNAPRRKSELTAEPSLPPIFLHPCLSESVPPTRHIQTVTAPGRIEAARAEYPFVTLAVVRGSGSAAVSLRGKHDVVSGPRPSDTRTSHVGGPREISCPAFRAVGYPRLETGTQFAHTRGGNEDLHAGWRPAY